MRNDSTRESLRISRTYVCGIVSYVILSQQGDAQFCRVLEKMGCAVISKLLSAIWLVAHSYSHFFLLLFSSNSFSVSLSRSLSVHPKSSIPLSPFLLLPAIRSNRCIHGSGSHSIDRRGYYTYYWHCQPAC